MSLHIDDGGKGGVPVVFVHGLGADLEVWRAQLDHLRTKRRALAYDQRGHGRSPRAEAYTIGGLAEDLEEVVARLDRFWLVGHSFSGVVLSTYAGRHPEKLAGLVYVDAVGDASGVPGVTEYFRKRDAEMTQKGLRPMYLEMLGPLARPETKAQVTAAAERMDLKAYVTLRAQMAEVRARELLERYQGPRFAIDAAFERDSPIMARKLPGVQVQVIEKVSHWLMLDEPEQFNCALDEVLK